MKNETIERTYSKKEYQQTIDLVNRGVKGLLILKNGLGDYTQERQEWLFDRAIDDVICVIWKLSKREKPYEQFKKEYLETELAAFGLEE